MQREKFNKMFYGLCKSKGKEFDSIMCDLWFDEIGHHAEDVLERSFKMYVRDYEPRLILGRMIETIKPETSNLKAIPEETSLTPEEREYNKKKFSELMNELKWTH